MIPRGTSVTATATKSSAGRRLLVIGGSSSVGQNVASALVARGDMVLATYFQNSPQVDGRVKWVQVDLRALSTFPEFIRDKVVPFGTLDAVLFLVGTLPGTALMDYAPDLMTEVMTINFTAQAYLTQLLLPHMAEQGLMLMIGSISGERGSYDPLYAASKAAMIGFVKSVAMYHGARVRVNCLSPGLIENSGMYKEMSPERREFHRQLTPTGNLLQLADLANVIVDLTQLHWRHLNGAVIRLNGGSYM